MADDKLKGLATTDDEPEVQAPDEAPAPEAEDVDADEATRRANREAYLRSWPLDEAYEQR